VACVVSALPLASEVQGSSPELGTYVSRVVCWFSPPFLRGFFSGFPSLNKNQHDKFQFDQESRATGLLAYRKTKAIYLFLFYLYDSMSSDIFHYMLSFLGNRLSRASPSKEIAWTWRDLLLPRQKSVPSCFF